MRRAETSLENATLLLSFPSRPLASLSLSLSLFLFLFLFPSAASYRGARGRSGAVPRPVISGGLTRITMYNHSCRERLRPIINTAMLAGRINNANNTLRSAIHPLPVLSHPCSLPLLHPPPPPPPPSAPSSLVGANSPGQDTLADSAAPRE